ncbi:electron transfer flavoprotein subunit alpha/FixB family protein [Paraoerskovia marina]|uniref:electron transfer flavoprotein subunit alpha/FixB family protein n=1 Tax=Paraoerskovia marina TaxID=545619 RepID=UPI00049252A1|nr:electron transfer flavoprotein subunit alpha/FixB family protein [Paraoerskovia marina]
MTNRTVLVLLDTPATALRSPALEILTLARSLGRVEAVVTESPSVQTLAQLGSHGVELVRQAELPSTLGESAHLSTTVAQVLAAAVRAADADAVLLTSNFVTKEIAARVAHDLDAGLVVDAATLVEGPDGRLVAGKRVLAGSWDTECEITTDVSVVTVRSNAVVPATVDQPVETTVEGFAVDVAAGAVTVVERTVEEIDDAGRPELAEAGSVVVGGRGTDGDFGPVEEFASSIGAAVGATRDVVFEGWFDQFVGQTGVTVTPRLYVGAGVSGAPHHRGGMQASQVVVAVNNDPECPLFEIADFAVVGDLADVLPQAAAAIRAHKES